MNNNTENYNEVIDKLREEIDSTLKIMDEMCNFIYKGEGIKVFDKLNEFINGLEFILSKVNYFDDDTYGKKIDVMLINIENAISIKDYVLFTDALLYELKPMIQKYSELLEMKVGNYE